MSSCVTLLYWLLKLKTLLTFIVFYALLLLIILNLDRPVFTPDLPWKEKATQVNSVLDIHVSK